MLKSYVAFDIETTGLSPEHNEIIEIGALKVREGKVVDRFIRFIEPEAGIPPMITQLTGITNDMVEGAGNCGEVLPEFLEFCEQDTLIGHNVQFDFSFVKTKAKELGYTYDHMGIDTLKDCQSCSRRPSIQKAWRTLRILSYRKCGGAPGIS